MSDVCQSKTRNNITNPCVAILFTMTNHDSSLNFCLPFFPFGLFCGRSQISCHSYVTVPVCISKGNLLKHSNSIIKLKKINSFLTSPNTQSVLRFSLRRLFRESIFSSLFKLCSRCCLVFF